MVPSHYTFIWVNENIRWICLTESGSVIWEDSILLCHLIFIHTWSAECVHILHVWTPPNFESRFNNESFPCGSLKTFPFEPQSLSGGCSYSAYPFPSYQAMSMSGSVSHTQSTLFLWHTRCPLSLSTIEQTMSFASFCILYLRHILCYFILHFLHNWMHLILI